MRIAQNPHSSTIEQVLADVEARWQKALPFFRNRKRVVFLSYCRFWEKHAFVQQSLAKVLVESGIQVDWFDGTGWRKYEPTLYWDSPLLRVKALFEPPGQRFEMVRRRTLDTQAREIGRALGGDSGALLWVQAGIEEGLAERLPHIDVFSTFDDLYRHEPRGALCQKAKVVFCQNSAALRTMKSLGPKALLALPPIDMEAKVFQVGEPIQFPSTFPKKIAGYVGSFFAKDYDLILFEDFVRSFPNVGFLLAGRTDSAGEKRLERLISYPNFLYVPWVKRSQIAPLWKSLDVNLLLYRPLLEQDGAFPTKILEALYFNVPSVATKTLKTEDIESFCPRTSFPDQLKNLAAEVLAAPRPQLESTYAGLVAQMHPKIHLARVADSL